MVLRDRGLPVARSRLWRSITARTPAWAPRAAYAVILLGLLLQLALVLISGRAFGLLWLRLTGSVAASAVLPVVALLLAPVALRVWRGRSPAGGAAGAVLLAGGALIVYLANGTAQSSGDTVPARYLPLSILREGNFDLNEFPFLLRGEPLYSLASVNGRIVSEYPVGAALLALPVFALPALAGVPAESRFIIELEKLAAAIVTAASVFVVFLVVREFCSTAMAVAIGAVYAIGSSSLSTSSQALWQHGPVQLSIAAALYALLRARGDPRWALGAGFALSFAVVCRPPTALMVAPLAVYAALRLGSRGLALCAAGAAAPLAFQVWYNAVYFGTLMRTQFSVSDPALWGTPFWHGLAGVLWSPGRGLLVYSPVFALAFAGAVLAWSRRGDLLIRCAGVGAMATVALYSKWTMWWGGHSYGPRLLADTLPLLALLLVPMERWLAAHRPMRALFAAAAVWSIYAHAVGAFLDGPRWNGYPDVNRFPERLWTWRDNPLEMGLRSLIDAGVIAARRLPTSRTRPDLLSGHVIASSDGTVRRDASDARHVTVEVAVSATNDGRAVWLSRGPGDVVLAWRWGAASAAGGEGARYAGLHYLLRDVFPGGEYRSTMIVDVSKAPLGGALEIGVVAFGRDGPRWLATVRLPGQSPTAAVELR